MLTHRARLLIIGIALTALLAATMLLEAPEATRTVDVVMSDPEGLEGRTIAIRGEVLDGSIDKTSDTFILHGEMYELSIDFTKATVSNGLADNRTVYAEGILVHDGNGWVFEADIIKTSCPSKYEAETTE